LRQCAGCFNPGSHDRRGGYELSVPEIIAQIPFEEASGITVSGGEPFEQPGELAALLEEAGKRGLNRLVYTGFTYEELIGHENRLVARCLPLIDMLIDGPYKKEEPPDMPWAGSGNQRILELCHGEIGKKYEKKDVKAAGGIVGELIIDQSGRITATGLIDSKPFD